MSNEPQAPVACSLSQQDSKQRGERWQALASRARRQVIRTDAGARLTFSAGPGVAAELGELAELERDCCSFAQWTLTTEDDQVILDVTAADAVAIAAIQDMFSQELTSTR